MDPLFTSIAIIWSLLIPLAIVWSMAWKGIALWRAGRNSHLVWFLVMFIINTVGILEIIYIFAFSHLIKNFFKTFSYFINKHFLSSFRTPNKMVVNQKYLITRMFIFHNVYSIAKNNKRSR